MKGFARTISKVPLHWQIGAGVVLGAIAGYFFPGFALKVEALGKLFLRALQMIIVPLVFASVAAGTFGAGSRAVGRLAGKTFVYYILSSLAAIFTGQLLVNVIRPGAGANLSAGFVPHQVKSFSGSLSDVLVNLLPANPVKALADGNMIQIIIFALLCGFFIIRMKNEEKRHSLVTLVEGIFELMMDMTGLIIRFAPIGVFALIAATIARSGMETFAFLGKYAVTVTLGLAFHAFVTLPIIQRVLGGTSPVKICRAVSPALLTAFSTSSSSATLPITLERAERGAGIPNRIAGFVLPLGATVNMDGTALYECVAAVFVAQAYGIDLSFGQQMIVAATALLASVGAAGIPMAGLVMLAVVLKAVGLPLEGVGLILAVDRVLDMMRTTVNVWSDVTGSVVVSRWEGERVKISPVETTLEEAEAAE